MGQVAMDRRHIVMNFTTPPSIEDIEVIAQTCLTEGMPDEMSEMIESLTVEVEDMPDEALELEMELDHPYELVALYKSGRQIAPGVERKVANDDDVLILFRRALLDLWGETGEDINILVRQVMIEELGQHFEFGEREIDEMVRQHHQGRL